jgi:hypothetical protein
MRHIVLVSVGMVRILMLIILVMFVCSCNIKVNTNEGNGADSVKPGISIKIIDKSDSVDNKNIQELAKMPDTAVERINRMGDSTRAVLKEKKKEIQKDIEQ